MNVINSTMNVIRIAQAQLSIARASARDWLRHSIDINYLGYLPSLCCPLITCQRMKLYCQFAKTVKCGPSSRENICNLTIMISEYYSCCIG